MVKIDPYKHKERWNRWKERTANGIPDISKKNSEIIKQSFRHPKVDRQDLKTKATNYNKANANDITLGCLTGVVGGWGVFGNLQNSVAVLLFLGACRR